MKPKDRSRLPTMVDPQEAIEKARKAVTERAELPGMSLMEHLEELRKLGGFMIDLTHPPVDFVERGLRSDHFREDRFYFAVEGPSRGGHPFLREIPDADVFRLRDLSLVRGHLTHKYPEKRGFPRTVGTDKPDPVVRADAEGDLIEEIPFAEFLEKVDGGDHYLRLYFRGCGSTRHSSAMRMPAIRCSSRSL